MDRGQFISHVRSLLSFISPGSVNGEWKCPTWKRVVPTPRELPCGHCFAFTTSGIQHYSCSTSTYSTHLEFKTPRIQFFCIQHYLISTIMDSTILVFNKPEFNNIYFQYPWFQQSLFLTILYDFFFSFFVFLFWSTVL